MTLENCKVLLKHFLATGMLEEAANMKANMESKGFKEVAPPSEEPKSKPKLSKKS